MHRCLEVDEILRLFAGELVASGAKAAAVSLACCRRSFEDPVLDVLWGAQTRLFPLLKSFPGDVWKVEAGRYVSPLTILTFLCLITLLRKVFMRLATKEEWHRFRKRARRMTMLIVDASKDLVTSEVLPTLQLGTGGEPLFPRLEGFGCVKAPGDFVPFVSLFLSPKTVDICFRFVPNAPTLTVALTITRLPALCPHIISLVLNPLPRNPAITEVVSEMLLTCNPNTLQLLSVDSPLTEDARGVVYRLPRLYNLSVLIQGPVSLPPVELPNLETICLEWNSGFDWLEGFRGATIRKLESITFRPTGAQIDGFLEEFQSVALTISAQETLSKFSFYTSQSWTPNYSSLFVFKRLTKLEVEFSCHIGCSSTVDDDTVIKLAEAMPGLKILRLGGPPCRVVTGVTFKGLVSLALRCPQLSELCVHLQANKLADATYPLYPSEPTTFVSRTECALTDLQVGSTRLAEQAALAVGISLLQLFPELVNIKYTNSPWKKVADVVRLSRRIGGRIHDASKTCLQFPR